MPVLNLEEGERVELPNPKVLAFKASGLAVYDLTFRPYFLLYARLCSVFAARQTLQRHPRL